MSNAKKLIWARKETGFSQSEVAKLMEVQPRTVIRWEKGETPFPTNKLKQFLQLVNVSPADYPAELKDAEEEEEEVLPDTTPAASTAPVEKGDDRLSKVKYNQEGYDCFGFGRDGYNAQGYPRGFKLASINDFQHDIAMWEWALKMIEGKAHAARAENRRLCREKAEEDDPNMLVAAVGILRALAETAHKGVSGLHQEHLRHAVAPILTHVQTGRRRVVEEACAYLLRQKPGRVGLYHEVYFLLPDVADASGMNALKPALQAIADAYAEEAAAKKAAEAERDRKEAAEREAAWENEERLEREREVEAEAAKILLRKRAEARVAAIRREEEDKRFRAGLIPERVAHWRKAEEEAEVGSKERAGYARERELAEEALAKQLAEQGGS